MTGQRERITFRAVVKEGRAGSFLPPFGIGYGLGEDLGIVLNRTLKGTPRFRTTYPTVVGVVVAEDADHVTIKRDDGRRLRIPVSDIIERTEIA